MAWALDRIERDRCCETGVPVLIAIFEIGVEARIEMIPNIGRPQYGLRRRHATGEIRSAIFVELVAKRHQDFNRRTGREPCATSVCLGVSIGLLTIAVPRQILTLAIAVIITYWPA
jgi:hypothetical protein